MQVLIRRPIRALASIALLTLGLMFVTATEAGAQHIDGPITANGGTHLTSVSCANANLCVTLDQNGNALTYNGVSWSTPSEIDGDTLSSVSCPTANFCMGVGGNNSITYNASSWSASANIVESSGYAFNLVSCSSASFCMALGAGYAVTYNGSLWSVPFNISDTAVTSLSCPSSSFCIAVASGGNALTYNGSSWSAPSDIDGATNLYSVSCASANFCASVDQAGAALTYNGSLWSSPTALYSEFQVFGVSCPSASFCMTAGYAVDQYNGASWLRNNINPAPDHLFAVSCPSATFCAVVGTNGLALTFALSTANVLLPANGGSVSGSTTLDASASYASSVSFALFQGSNTFAPKQLCTATDTPYGWLCSWDTSTVPNGSYTLVAESGGSASAFSPGVSITVSNPPPPTTSVVFPSNGTTLSGSTTLGASASNANSVVFYVFGGSYGYLGKQVCAATATPYGWICNWNTTSVPNGSYVLSSQATNASGSTLSSGVGISVKN
jgi:hypothetical protein